MTAAMAECFRIFEEIIRMHPPKSLEPHPGRVWVYRANEVDEINKRADKLNELSWSCKEYGKSIRVAVSILKTLISKPNEDVDKKWLSSEIGSLVKIRDGIFEYLK